MRWAGLGDRLFHTTDERFDVQRCDDCTAHFLAVMPELQQQARYYPDDYWVAPKGRGRSAHGGLLERYRRFVLRDHVHFVRRVLRSQRERGRTVRVLDVGCGDGSFLAALGEPDCIGMDLSLPALRACRARGIRALRSTLAEGALGAGAFSLVTAFHFLEHVHPAGPVLAAMRALLAPGGELVLQVPNLRCWQAKVLGRRWAGLDVPRHLVDYSDRTLLRLLEDSGFAVVARTQHSLRDNPTTLANSLVPGLYPPARIARGGGAAGLPALLANLGYLAVTVACTPFAALESLCGHGASVMVHARPR
ncbi:MAG TPA: class I SAM-dependent methyltransferase [Planctomycetota bacterium]|nr:class I SAM-dependent methyltransferase [Planctomycetota bacterium]